MAKTPNLLAASATREARRQQLIKLIHVGKRDLRMQDEDYRQLLRSLTKSESTSDLDIVALQQVLSALTAKGFKISHKSAKPAKSGNRSRPLDQAEQARKLRALWLHMHELGIVRSAEESALCTYIKRQTGVEALQWLNGEQFYKAIEALKKWQFRALLDGEFYCPTCGEGGTPTAEGVKLFLKDKAVCPQCQPATSLQWRKSDAARDAR
jgi:phage gp16-like protein